MIGNSLFEEKLNLEDEICFTRLHSEWPRYVPSKVKAFSQETNPHIRFSRLTRTKSERNPSAARWQRKCNNSGQLKKNRA